MLLGFYPQFEPFVGDKTKTHTIRERRAIPPKPGDRLDLYGDTRQASMHLIARHPCTRVQEISIHHIGNSQPLVIFIDGVQLSPKEAEAFAWRDGFREPGRASIEQMRDFARRHRRKFPWTGDLIHWDAKIDCPPPFGRNAKRKAEPAAVTRIDGVRAAGALARSRARKGTRRGDLPALSAQRPEKPGARGTAA